MTDVPSGLQFTRTKDLAAERDEGGSWYEVVVSDGRNRVGLICALPGTPPDPHIHPDYNEWWINLGGTTQWQIGQYEPLLAEWGDIVIAPAGYCHDIRSKGTGLARRLHVSTPNSNHDIRGVSPTRFVPIDYGLSMPNLLHTRFGPCARGTVATPRGLRSSYRTAATPPQSSVSFPGPFPTSGPRHATSGGSCWPARPSCARPTATSTCPRETSSWPSRGRHTPSPPPGTRRPSAFSLPTPMPHS